MTQRAGLPIEVCSDCDDISRRGFLRSVGAAAMLGAGATGLTLPGSRRLVAATFEDTAPSAAPRSDETVVKALYDSLSEKQRAAICMPFDHEKRSEVRNNWHIVPQAECSIGKFYTADQKALITEILRGVTSEDGFERFQKQMQDDDGGFDNYTCAVFGEPGSGKFEWVMTGRHLTIRADGGSVENTAFGGPIFYGHAVTGEEKPDHPGNVWWHQARLANKVYEALDGKQREKALVVASPADRASVIDLRKAGEPEGIAAADMSSDQKELLEATLRSMLSMYRKSDVDEALDYIKKAGGIDQLRLSFFQEGDLGDDGVWDRWMVRGPALAWYFRGSPHVHTWVNIARYADGAKAEKRERTARAVDRAPQRRV